jgi:hypothetical protein
MNTCNEQGWVKYFSFKAVLVGALVAFGLMFLFTLLTYGGGLSAYTRTEKGLEAVVMATYLWTVVGGFVILFIGGLVTSMVVCHNSRWMESSKTVVGTAPVGTMEVHHHHCHRWLLHGFLTFVMFVIITVLMANSVSKGTVLSLPQNFLAVSSETAGTTADAASNAASNVASATVPSSNEAVNPAVREEAHRIGLAALAAFFVFFVEALAACFGAWCGVEYTREMCRKNIK